VGATTFKNVVGKFLKKMWRKIGVFFEKQQKKHKRREKR